MKLIKIVDDLKDSLKTIDTLIIHEVKKCLPISKEELESIEVELDLHFPNELSEIYLNEASMIKLKWWDEKKTFGSNLNSGEFHLLSPSKANDMYKDIAYEVQQAKKNSEFLEDEGLQAIVKDWLHWIPIISFANGDAFCIDKRNLQIVFFEHDVMDVGPNIHGITIAMDFNDLILKWSKIAFVDVYNWSEVCDSYGLNINRELFKSIRAFLTTI